MNNSIKEKLNNIMKGEEGEIDPSSLNQDLGYEVKDEISSFFKPNQSNNSQSKIPEINMEVEDFKAKKAKKEKVQKDVENFIKSLPDDAPKPIVTSVKMKLDIKNPQKSEDNSEDEEEEEVKERELTKEYLMKK